MDPLTNPYAPGAGTPPPELAGRDEILNTADLTIRRSQACRPARSLMLIGLRGVGKTVLLNRMQEMADALGAVTDFFETGANGPLAHAIANALRSALLRLDRAKSTSRQVKRALRVLKSFAGGLRVRYGDIDLSITDVDAEPGMADSGTLSRDLADLFIAAGEAARDRASSIVILIDEIQNLAGDDFEALLMAVHRANQACLPVLVVGAGLPSLIKLSGDARSYAERLFDYRDIGALDPDACRRALVGPAVREGAAFSDDAIAMITARTGGYPYFLQEWGYQLWNMAHASPFTANDVMAAETVVIERLDGSFFRSRYERLTDPQKAYLRAMAEIGPGPCRTNMVARVLGRTSSQVGSTREALIAAGMIYSPRYGEASFTVPLFDEFMKRVQPIS